MKWALINPENPTRILDIVDTKFPVAPPLTWVDSEDPIERDWTYVNGKFVAPIPEQTQINNIPRIVTMRQARLALLYNKDLQRVDTIIKGSPEAVQIEWEYATNVDRDSDLVKGLAVVLGYSETTLDQLFSRAASL